MIQGRKKRLKPLLSFVKSSKKKQELWCDVGAGSGFFSELLQDKLLNAEIIQLDKKIRKNKRRLFIRGDATKLPFRPLAFDGVLCSQMLHYFPSESRQNITRQISDIITPEGTFIIIEYEAMQSFSWIPHPLPSEKIRREIMGQGQFCEKRLVKVDFNYRPKYALYLQKE